MKKNILMATGLAATLIVGAYFLSPRPTDTSETDLSDSPVTRQEYVPDCAGEYAPPAPLTDSNTVLYENSELGFSMRFPKAIESRCEDGTVVSSRKISVLPDPKGNRVIIMIPVGDEKLPQTLEELSKVDLNFMDAWEIHFTDVRPGESKTDMANRVLNYPDFKYSDLKNSEMAGNDPSVYYGGGEGFIAIKESPSGKRAAIWKLGLVLVGALDRRYLEARSLSGTQSPIKRRNKVVDVIARRFFSAEAIF